MGTVHHLFPDRATPHAVLATGSVIRFSGAQHNDPITSRELPKGITKPFKDRLTAVQHQELSLLTAAVEARDEDFKRMWMNKADQAALSIKTPPITAPLDERHAYESAHTCVLHAPGYDARQSPARYGIWIAIVAVAVLAIALTPMGWLPTFGG